MRALVITAHHPQHKGIELTGAHSRFRLFVEAISEIAENIEIVHLVGERFIAAHPDLAEVGSRQAAYFGLPIVTHLIEVKVERVTNFANHYLTPIWSAYEQDGFHWACGAEQIAGVRARFAQEPDIVFVHRLPAMLAVLRSKCRPACPVFFDLDDVEHRRRAQEALIPPRRLGRLGYLCQIPALVSAEQRGAALSRMTFVCSEADRTRVRRLGFPRIEVVPNALPVPASFSELPTCATVLFIGICWHAPNARAADRLARRIFPRIRAALPEAGLLLAGKGSFELASRSDRPAGVEYLGYVEDLDALYASARLICCPVTSGSGTRVKLIEAAGYARPMVATRFAAEGLDFRDGVEILLRDDDDAIAAACVRLLRDDALSRALGLAARARMRQKYDASAIRQRIAALMARTAAAGVTERWISRQSDWDELSAAAGANVERRSGQQRRRRSLFRDAES